MTIRKINDWFYRHYDNVVLCFGGLILAIALFNTFHILSVQKSIRDLQSRINDKWDYLDEHNANLKVPNSMEKSTTGHEGKSRKLTNEEMHRHPKPTPTP